MTTTGSKAATDPSADLLPAAGNGDVIFSPKRNKVVGAVMCNRAMWRAAVCRRHSTPQQRNAARLTIRDC
jgi:hypothetical protein